jgi:peptide subunit release factor 1 (eRF1)
VLSVFVNLDPADLPTPDARASAIRSALDDARRSIGSVETDHEGRRLLESDVERVSRHLTEGFSADGAHAIAIFAAGAAELFDVIKLPRPLETQVVVDDRPFVVPLSQMAREAAIWVVLVDRRSSRLFSGSGEVLREVGEVERTVHGRHSQGGWSQARYQRSIEHDVEDHLERTARGLLAVTTEAPLDHLLIGATSELAAAFERHLHPALAERLLGRFSIDVGGASAETVREAIAPLLAEERERTIAAALGRLEGELASGNGRAAAGVPNVLEALNERRVELLLSAPGQQVAGVRCPTCGWLAAEGERCPADGSQLESRENVIADAVDAALLQSARVLMLEPQSQLERHGALGALLRF